MKYQCCACQAEFPAEEAIDGFSRGYRVGFLCPVCGAHLQDNIVDTHWIIREGKGVAVALVLLGAIGTLAIRSGHSFPWHYYAIYFLAFAAIALYGYLKYPGLQEDAVMSTRPGPGANGERD